MRGGQCENGAIRTTLELTLVGLGVALLPLEDALVDGDDTGVVLAGVVDGHGVAKRSVGVEEVLGARGEGGPLGSRGDRAHELPHGAPSLLNLRRSASAVRTVYVSLVL